MTGRASAASGAAAAHASMAAIILRILRRLPTGVAMLIGALPDMTFVPQSYSWRDRVVLSTTAVRRPVARSRTPQESAAAYLHATGAAMLAQFRRLVRTNRRRCAENVTSAPAAVISEKP